jgi:PadR family transcriptional regulator AphA
MFTSEKWEDLAMSLKYAVLGLLSFKPQTGYELKANFEQSIRYLWNADQAQIYRTLAEITKEGLTVSHTVQQTERPNKKVYNITKAGEDELKQWLANPLQSKDQHNAELVQIFFSGKLSDEEVLTNLKKLRYNIVVGLSGLSSLETKSELFNLKNKSLRSRFFFYSTLQLGIHSAELNLKWIDEMIEKIESGGLPQE